MYHPFHCEVFDSTGSSRLVAKVTFESQTRAVKAKSRATHTVVFGFYVRFVDLRLLLNPWRRGASPKCFDRDLEVLTIV
jgi:hypothetical protein